MSYSPRGHHDLASQTPYRKVRLCNGRVREGERRRHAGAKRTDIPVFYSFGCFPMQEVGRVVALPFYAARQDRCANFLCEGLLSLAIASPGIRSTSHSMPAQLRIAHDSP
jgi:hypothetical protein